MELPTSYRIARETVRRNVPDYNDEALDGLVTDYIATAAAIDADQTLTNMGKAMRKAEAATKYQRSLQPMREAIERSERAIDAEVNTQLAKLAPARPTSTLEEQRHSEIRAYLRTLQPSERRRAVLDAMQANDVEVIAAVEFSPATLPIADAHIRQLIDYERRAKAEAAVPDLADRRGELMLKRHVLNAAASVAPEVSEDAAA